MRRGLAWRQAARRVRIYWQTGGPGPVGTWGGQLYRMAEGAMLMQRGHLVTWVPVAFGLGIAIYFHLPREPSVVVLIIAGGLIPAGVLAGRVMSSAFAPFGFALALMAAGGLTATLRANAVAAPVLAYRYYGPVEGRVVEIDRSASDALRLTLDNVVLADIDPARTPARVRVSLQEDPVLPMPRAGDVVILTANLSPPNGPVEPGDFDFRMQAWFEGLGAVGYSRTPVMRLHRAPDDMALWVARTRYVLSGGLMALVKGDAGGLAAAVMTGDRSGLSQAGSDAMRDANLYHLVSISGMHMGMLVAIVFAAVRGTLAAVPPIALRWPLKKVAAVIALPVAFFYLLLAGRDVATERAFVMSAVMLGAILLDRQAISLRVVAIAGFGVLLFRPESLFSAGFQMSFAAVVALVAVFQGLRGLSARLERWRWIVPVVMLLLSSLIAGLATAPYSAAHFNRMAHYGLLANLVAVPVMGFVVMPAAIFLGLTAPLGLIEPARSLIDLGGRLILWASGVIAGWSGAVTLVPRPPAAILPLITCGGLLVCLWQGRGRWMGLPCLALALVIWMNGARPDLLISQSGGIVGILGPDGRALSRPEGEAFTADNWRGNDGEPLPQSAPLSAMRIAGRRATGDIAGVTVLVLRGAGALAETQDCDGAGIMVISVNDDATRPCVVLDPAVLARTGAVAGHVTAEGLRLVTAADLAGDRLWTKGSGDDGLARLILPAPTENAPRLMARRVGADQLE